MCSLCLHLSQYAVIFTVSSTICLNSSEQVLFTLFKVVKSIKLATFSLGILLIEVTTQWKLSSFSSALKLNILKESLSSEEITSLGILLFMKTNYNRLWFL